MTPILHFINTLAPDGEYITLMAGRNGEVRSFYRVDHTMMAAWLRKHRGNAPAISLLPFDEPIDRPFKLQDVEQAGYVAVRAPLERDNIAAVRRVNACAGELPPTTLQIGAPAARTLVWKLNRLHPVDELAAVAEYFAEVMGHGAAPVWDCPVRNMSGQALLYWAPGRAYDLGPLRIRRISAPVAQEPEPVPFVSSVTAPAALLSHDASTLAPRPLRWVWKGKIMCGQINLIAGEGGVGKSTISRGIAAIVSNGGTWPTGEMCEPGCVVFLECEDLLQQVTIPDLIAAGANMERIRVGGKVFDLSEDISPLVEMVEAVERKTGLPVVLIVLSPFRSFYTGKSGRESYNNAEVRARLALTEAYAEKTGVAILGVHHPKEGSDSFAGSQAWKERARSGLFAKWSDGVGSPRFIYPLKSNSGRVGWTLAYDTADAEVDGCEAKFVVWGEQSNPAIPEKPQGVEPQYFAPPQSDPEPPKRGRKPRKNAG